MRVLVLGGTEFMGRTFIEALFAMTPQPEIYMINRGNTYWNTEIHKDPRVNHYYGDRTQFREFEKLLRYLSSKFEGKFVWDLVVDFSCYERKQMKSAIRGLSDKCKLYVYISTDSVYDVCDRKLRREELIREEYSIRPEKDEMIEELNQAELYGNDKLRCEEYLKTHVNPEKFRYINLRLPDVIGPYDPTERFWGYLIWLRNCNKYPIHKNKHFDGRELSFVYSKDVSNILIRLLNYTKDEEKLGQISGESFNISCSESITLKDFIETMAVEEKMKEPRYINEKELSNALKCFYPSVECGPLNNKKARAVLGFEPTGIKEVIRDTYAFFAKAEKFEKEYKKAVEKFQSTVSAKSEKE